MKLVKFTVIAWAILLLSQEHHAEAEKKVAECKASGSDSDNCRNAKEGLFRYKQLHAVEPSFKDAFKGIVKDEK